MNIAELLNNLMTQCIMGYAPWRVAMPRGELLYHGISSGKPLLCHGIGSGKPLASPRVLAHGRGSIILRVIGFLSMRLVLLRPRLRA